VGDLNVTCNGGRTGRFGRLLGLGLPVARAIEQMEGATLECLDILQVVRAALPSLQRRGQLAEDELPLLRHLASVALDGAEVRVPFERFFAGGGQA
jgi:glycerol-3-phosphate dehydrogenase (NAD(P)+)